MASRLLIHGIMKLALRKLADITLSMTTVFVLATLVVLAASHLGTVGY